MLIEHTLDLFESDCNVIIHCANCFCTMGAGFAKQLAIRHPEAVVADNLTKRGDISKLGDISFAYSHGKLIFNIYGQYRYGTDKRHVDYDALEFGLLKVKIFLDEYKFEKDFIPIIGMPRIGCGLAGGDWEIVKPIIRKIFGETNIHIHSI